MTFVVTDFKQVGSNNNNATGGQIYSAWSAGDNLATMAGSGYFDLIADKIHTGDAIITNASDGVAILRLVNTAGVITTV